MPKNAILSGFEILIIKSYFESSNDLMGAGPRIFGTDPIRKINIRKWRGKTVGEFLLKLKIFDLDTTQEILKYPGNKNIIQCSNLRVLASKNYENYIRNVC